MRWIALLALALAIAPVASGAAVPYVLQPEDVLTVSVYGHEELSRDVVVLDDGQFSYPIVGRVTAAGKSTDAVADAIARGLSQELNSPQVTVSVKQPAMRRVYISGVIAKAGSYDLKPGWRVSHLIAEAGGLAGASTGAIKPELVRATLIRGDQNIPVDLVAILSHSDRTADIELQPGDLLQVQPDTNLVHVAGQVKSPGDYQVKDKLGVLEAISMAGGTMDDAALTRAQVIRSGEVLKVDLYALLVEGKVDQDLALRPGDTLVVPRNDARIAVLGGVSQPGYYDLPDGKAITVADAVGLAKGSQKYAKTDHIAIMRVVDGKQVVSEVNLNGFLKKGDLSQNPTVQPGDVIYIAEGKEPITRAGIFSALVSLANPFIYGIMNGKL